MTNDLTAILEDLASGRIDAAEAGRRIDATKDPQDPQEPKEPQETRAQAGEEAQASVEPTWGAIARDLFGAASGFAQEAARGAAHSVDGVWQHSSTVRQQPGKPEQDGAPSGQGPVGSHGVGRVQVRATGRRVRIIGDASIATLAADGPHVLRRSGDVLEVTSDGELGDGLGGFSLLRSPLTGSLLNQGLGGLRNLGLDDLRGIGLGKELLLRVNPAIAVDVELTAGSLATINLPLLGRVRVTAGGAQLGDVRQVTDALVQAGSLTARGRFDRGRSRVRVESGNLVVGLAGDADVAVHADAQLGRVVWPGGGAALHEYTAGDGAGRLDLAVVMGAASVRHDGHDETPNEDSADEHSSEQEERA